MQEHERGNAISEIATVISQYQGQDNQTVNSVVDDLAHMEDFANHEFVGEPGDSSDVSVQHDHIPDAPGSSALPDVVKPCFCSFLASSLAFCMELCILTTRWYFLWSMTSLTSMISRTNISTFWLSPGTVQMSRFSTAPSEMLLALVRYSNAVAMCFGFFPSPQISFVFLLFWMILV